MTHLPSHLLLFGGVFGATVYQSFYSGIVAYKALPIEMFSKLQHRIFPGYFAMQTVLTTALIMTSPFKLKHSRYSLVLAAATALANIAVVIPLTDKVLTKREAQMELEGKTYKDPTASETMKALNKQFGKLHGISMLLGLGTLVGLTHYGWFLGNNLRIIAF